MVILDRYEVGHPIGKGGMGEVYSGHDRQLDRKVAIKFIRCVGNLPPEELERRFLREARIMARLDHPGAPAIYDVGSYDDPQSGERRLFEVMQFVKGSTIADLLAELGPLPIGWVAGIAAQVCAVLGAAHELSILHRDLKPSNLMICPDGSVKVLDFGLAIFTDPRFSRYTRSGQVVGSAHYMSPEQVRAQPLGPGSDLYALGCVMYEMLTGKHVFPGPSEYETLHQQVSDAPRAASRIRGEIPRELDELVLGLLEKRPEDRPRDAPAVFAYLSALTSGTVHLPDFVHPASADSPVRMYARALAALVGGDRPDVIDQVRQPVLLDEEPQLTGVADLPAIRARVTDLVRESRYTQAVEILTEVAGSAERLLGSDDGEVLSLRLELADILFEGGDYRPAASHYRELASLYAQRGDDGVDLAFHCRLREASCRAMGGETRLALRQLTSLLQDERTFYGDADSRPLELRKQIAVLQLGAGDLGEAEHTLVALRSDIVRFRGPDHPQVAEVGRLIDEIDHKES
ncbi:serine/threonine-protein kinase [Streptosporangium sp. NPDC051022]|uniref:serine/threonine-protein kinase n=1 Tax=Streptosporangium sp. NPDC051022 TaxID=3155752 RepID=UPI00343B074B